jgi:hypothetical protein
MSGIFWRVWNTASELVMTVSCEILQKLGHELVGVPLSRMMVVLSLT